MNKLIYLLIFIILATSVSAIELNIDGKMGETINHQVSLTLLENQTAYINLIESDNRLEYEYTHEANTSNPKLNINITINAIFTANTTIQSIWQITNNYNEEIHNYTIDLNVGVDSSILDETYFDITIVNGEFTLNFTEDELPVEEDLPFTIDGEHGGILNVTCNAEWLSCSNSYTFDSNDQVQASIHISIPENTALGTYTLPIFFKTLNQSLSQNIVVSINRKEVAFTEYNMSDDCTMDFNGTLVYSSDCVFDMQSYYLKIAMELTERINEERNKTCVLEPNYIVAGNVSKIVMDEYEVCKSDRNNFQEKYTSCDSTLTSTKNELNNFREEYQINETECWKNIDETKKELQKSSQNYIDSEMIKVKKYGNRQLAQVWTLIILAILIGAFIYYKKQNEEVF